MKKRLLAALLSAAMVVTMFAGCSTPGSKSSSDDSSEKEGTTKKRVTYTLREDIPSADPQNSNSISSASANIHMLACLTRNVEGEVKGDAAESWDISDDGLVYTFHLRDGLKWSDGVDVTADDYVYGMQRLMDPEQACDYAFIGYILKNGAAVNNGEVPVEELGVKALDDKTVEITLEHPAVYFESMASMCSLGPARKDLVEKYGQEYAADPEKAAYNGPFMMTEWKHGDQLVMSKNPNYWDADSIKLDEICIKTVAEAKTAVAMWENGEVDITIVPTEMSKQYEENSEFYFTGADDYIMLNQTEGKALANKNLRFALNYAINRKEYNTLVNNDVYEPAQRLVLPNVTSADSTYGERYPYTPFPLENDDATAKDYLAKAMEELGVSNAADIKLELLTTDTEGAKKQAEVLQEQFQKNLGITVEIKQVTYKQRLEMEQKKEYDMVVTGWVPDYSDAYSYLELWISDGQYNHSGYNNARYDELLAASQTETDAEKRQDMLFEAEQIFLGEDSALVPLQLRRDQYLVNPKLENFNVYFVGYDFDLVYADLAE
ncbi:MAG: peptide ABC transporter substrate-binding protein [Bariatricus sp.]|nr:peptide ABC transporter substrate-binding protein [Bariatricus sp.]